MVRVIAGIYAGFGCAVVDGNATECESDWFMIKSGGKQGFLMSGLGSYCMAGETWKITKNDERKLISFQCRQCLRRILRIKW